MHDRAEIAIGEAAALEKARRRDLYQKVAAVVGQHVAFSEDLSALLRAVVCVIRESFNCHHVRIFLVDDEHREAVLREGCGRHSDVAEVRGLRLKIGLDSLIGRVAYTGQALLCNEVSQELCSCDRELPPETRAELAVALRVGDRVVGVLDVQSERFGAFRAEDLAVLEIVASQLAMAVENIWLVQETKSRYQELAALYETSLDLVSHLEMPGLLKALLSRAVHLWDALVANLFLYDREQDLIYNLATSDTLKEYRDWTGVVLRPGQGLIGRVVLTGRALIVNDYREWEGKLVGSLGTLLTGGIGAPLRYAEEIIGGITVLRATAVRPFSDRDLALLCSFADMAGIAIKNAQLHMRVRELTEGLEQQVTERTEQLARAQQESAVRAEQLQLLANRLVRVQEEERAHIAHEMHDGPVQLITAARYELQAAKVAIEAGSCSDARERLVAAREVLNDAENEMRSVIRGMHPSILDALGLIPALKRHADKLKQQSGLICHVRIAGTPFQLPPRTELAAFRVVEQALQNVVTHADAKTASVLLEFSPSILRVTVRDNGKGFDAQKASAVYSENHLGLLGMEQRVESHGGKLHVVSSPARGTLVTFWLPLSYGVEGKD
jgi:signal transduction histidine kinase/putative methionine-R-sulfoxide reductase with GAF domain